MVVEVSLSFAFVAALTLRTADPFGTQSTNWFVPGVMHATATVLTTVLEESPSARFRFR